MASDKTKIAALEKAEKSICTSVKDKSRDEKSPEYNSLYNKEKCPFLLYARVMIEASSYTMCVNMLKKEGIGLYSIERKTAKKLLVTVKQKELVKSFAILDKMCYNYSVVEEVSMHTIIKAAFNKVALIASLVVFVAIYVFSYGFIWSIDIVGCDTLDPLVVKNLLSQNGISEYVDKSQLDLDAIELYVSSHEQILLSSVSISGTTLVVEVVEVTEFAESPLFSSDNIVSEFDATITKIISYSGTVAVDVGQHVFAGTDLILSSRMNSDGEEIAVDASGIVYGTVTKTLVYDVSLVGAEYERTGQSKTLTSYSLFGLEMGSCDYDGFEFYETETSEGVMCENLFIPLVYSQKTYYELQEVSVSYTLDELVETYKEEAFVEFIMPYGAENYTITVTTTQESDDEYKIYIFLQADLIIGQA